MLTLTLAFSTACVSTEVIEKPVPVPVPGPVQYIPIPDELLLAPEKVQMPTSLTYGEALKLWAEDRKMLDIASGNIDAIRLLEPE